MGRILVSEVLTAAQHEAVAHAGGPLLVIGGAGTGKSLLLAERFAWLVANGTAPESILALAFSRSELAGDGT